MGFNEQGQMQVDQMASSLERGPSSFSPSFSCMRIPLRDVLSSLVCHYSFHAPGDAPHWTSNVLRSISDSCSAQGLRSSKDVWHNGHTDDRLSGPGTELLTCQLVPQHLTKDPGLPPATLYQGSFPPGLRWVRGRPLGMTPRLRDASCLPSCLWVLGNQ